jgi:class 3 adenylate cyclase
MTDKLGDDIMEFINDVASVVHENVSAWGGQCNKNLGGSFLMTWKVPETYTRGTNVDVARIPYIAKIADRALIGFLKVTADLNRNEKILAYRRRADLQIQDKATGKMVPFKVRMGFGLHVGWGIEGPVGSMEKVDATYLSPHVNMAARCETAAKQWHVPVKFISFHVCAVRLQTLTTIAHMRTGALHGCFLCLPIKCSAKVHAPTGQNNCEGERNANERVHI